MHAQHTTLPDGSHIPLLGQGTWNMGNDSRKRKEEIAALRLGVELGMTLIDTAEMYGSGRSESLVGEALQGLRDNVFLVSKVLPGNAGGAALQRSCEASLRRLRTDYLDLYLLHWRGAIPLAETIARMEKLVADGKIRYWGVSNLDVDDMQALLRETDGEKCAVNQVLYHLGSRGVEVDLLPWQRARGIPMMAYCPLAQGGTLRDDLASHPAVQAIAKKHGASAMQVLLAWVLRDRDVIAIPKASSRAHVEENARAAALQLSDAELLQLNHAFPPPNRPVPLDIV